MDMRIINFPAGNLCTACRSEGKHFWVVSDALNAVWMYCLSCAFTKDEANKLHYDRYKRL